MSQCCFNISQKETIDKTIVPVNLDEDIWPSVVPLWTSQGNYKSMLLSDKNDTRYPPDLTLPEIIENSSKFPVPFPIQTVRCSYLKENVSSDLLEENINSVYPVIHEHALHLCSTFLSYQTQFGNVEFYKDMSLLQFIDRLLRKRVVAFLGTMDHYLLLDGTEGAGGWENVGTSNEKPPLILENCLSYDEMRLSAFLSLSSHTCFINNGNRRNRGIPETNMEESGVIIGLIGTRLPKKHVMEYREIVKSKEQNTRKNGYGRNCKHPTLQQKFLEFYGDINATYSEMVQLFKTSPERYIDFGDGDRFFDKLMYVRRIALSIDTLLIEANDRAKQKNTTAFVHVVGIGLGVWRICSEQNKLFGNVCAKRLEYLQDSLPNVSDVCFAYIGEKTIGPYQHGDKIGGITVHIDNKNPQEKLTDVHQGKLLVVSYAWDCNALPGNEFWFGSLDTSSDPAAACSTQVAELHNYHINGKVRGSNLRVATLKHGILSFREFQELHKED